MKNTVLDNLISRIGDDATKSLLEEFQKKADKIIKILMIATAVNILTLVTVAAMWIFKH